MAAVHGDFDLYDRDLFSGVGNALSSIFNPIFPGSGSTTSETSTSATLTLTDSDTATQTKTDTQSPTTAATQTLTSQTKSTAAPTTSSTTASTSSSTSASSATTSSSASTSAGTSTTSTSVNEPTSTPPPSVTTSVGPSGTVTLTDTSLVSSPSASATASTNAAASKGFLANKGLSVGVITACSLVGLVLLIVVATYAIRRRRRNKLHDEAVDFTPFPSSDELLSNRNDIERSGGGGVTGTRPSSRGSVGDDTLPSATRTAAPEMFQTGYAIPTYMPPSGPAPPPKATTTSTTNQVAFPSQAYANTMAGYNDYGPYPTYAAPVNPNAYQPQPAANMLAPRPGPSYNTAYGAATAAGAGAAPANPPVRKASQRKQVPPLNLSAARPDVSPPAYQLMNDTSVSPMVNPYGSTPNPVDPPLSAVSPAARRASASLLNSPVRLAYSDEGTSSSETATSERSGGTDRKRTSSHSRMLDPNMPTLPVAAPLPDEFGAQGAAAVVDEKAPIRHLTVRNE